MKEHPNYKNLYEPRQHNIEKLYDHKRELQYGSSADYKILCDTGLSFAVPIERLKIEDVNDEELKSLVKNGVIGLNDLKIKIDMQDNQ